MLGLAGGNGSFDIFGNHIIMVEKAASDAFTRARITYHNLVSWLKPDTESTVL